MNIIYNIINIINDGDHIGVSENIEILKGKYKIKTFKEKMKWYKRKLKTIQKIRW